MVRLSILSAAAFVAVRASVPIDDVDELFKQFVDDFGKIYSDAERELRREVFKQNWHTIQTENAKGKSYTLGITEFADMTSDEFALNYLGYRVPHKPWGELPSLGMHVRSNQTLPTSVDWRDKGAVSPVKNQAQCGSCWAFSTTGSLEGAWKIATGNLVSLSEQQMVDCSSSFGNHGCQGGLMDDGFKFAEQTALCTEESYPYKAAAGMCAANTCTVGIPKGSVQGFKDVKVDDTDALMDAVAQGPVSIAIEADKSVFQLYKSGVLSGDCGERLDHGVLLVGYGTEDGQDYWIVKNSWGASWGLQGYLKMLRGKAGHGECGLKQDPSYPVVTGAPAPGPSPAPAPTPSPPAPPATSHYEKPPCRSDEVEASVQGSNGALCAPSCDGTTCPADVPPGTRAKPQCMLQDSSSGKKYCALRCLMPGSCPAGAKCARVSGLYGVCVFPSDGLSKLSLEVVHQEEINV